jgi:hypothetical protein
MPTDGDFFGGSPSPLRGSIILLYGGSRGGVRFYTKLSMASSKRFFRTRAGSPFHRMIATTIAPVVPRTRGLLPRDKSSDGNR